MIKSIVLAITAIVIASTVSARDFNDRDKYYAGKCFNEVKAEQEYYAPEGKLANKYSYFQTDTITKIFSDEVQEVIGIKTTLTQPWGEKVTEYHTCYINDLTYNVTTEIAYVGSWRVMEYWVSKIDLLNDTWYE